MTEEQTMITADEHKARIGDIRVIAIVFFLATFMSLFAMSMLGLRPPLSLGAESPDEALILALVGSLVLASAITPVARGIRGTGVRRLMTLGAFTFVSFAVIAQLEAAVYSTIGGTSTMLVAFAPPCLLAAAVAAWLVRPTDESDVQPRVFKSRSVKTLWWRLALAFLALPVLEAVTGLVTQPLIEPLVREPSLGLVVPSGFVVVRTLLVKSGLLLAVTVPIVFAWTQSRRSLALALGFALFVLTGLVGLIQATWWPATVRVALSFQVFLTSMVSAWVMVALLLPRSSER